MRQVTVYSVLEAGVRRQVTGYRVQVQEAGKRQKAGSWRLVAGNTRPGEERLLFSLRSVAISKKSSIFAVQNNGVERFGLLATTLKNAKILSYQCFVF